MIQIVDKTKVRKMLRGIATSLLGAIVVACSACGGGGGDSNQPAPAQSQPAPKPVLIEAYGDSTTQGWQVDNGVGQVTPNNEPADLQKLLQAKFGSSVTVSNQGVGSTEASQLLNGTDGIHPTWQNQMAASKAQIITLNFGLNDAYYTIAKKDGIAAESPSDLASVMMQLVQIARQYGKQVVIFESNPTCEPIRQPLMPAYVAALRQAAAVLQTPIVAEFDAIQAIPNWQSQLTDCLHPSDALYAEKAALEFSAISNLIAKIQ
ncbi:MULTISPECIES: SGNH/GDSL hydrolase family protein [unclassified Burkholderia]|uniref:SGNH/GDSL hydrolase family protein n=1 Tax=unclassified Burkholderia TaxID=2613784 RepID=UPI000F55BA8A|nr:MULTISPECIES: SGNH/GDSL hydrolase family protein [unclassified Burkholderia]RQR87738.1 SGNH/GDSL hydrolase family protein [Burkholderia sp. Bp9011]RQR97081.1 SGNH/GDSL hydrolase family protein [Burkholderia sp. Bp9010]